MKKMLESGKIVNIHGLNGEVKAARGATRRIFYAALTSFISAEKKTESRSNRRESIKIWF